MEFDLIAQNPEYLMKIVFDLDYTLLDTAKFKEALAEAVTAQGVSRDRYEETYKAVVRREGKVYDYDPDAHLEALKDDFDGERAMNEARRGIAAVLAGTEKYLYPGAVELLRELRRQGAELVLMTLGNEKWQRAKVENSGLGGMFDEVLATEKKKVDTVREIGRAGDKIIIVNDNGEEMKEMMAAAPEYRYILKRGPKHVPADLKLPESRDMNELAALLSAETGWEIGLERRGETFETRRPGPSRRPRTDGGPAEASVHFGPEKRI